jgi:hypothetical protein
LQRFRLKFLLQEFDLPMGEVVIGRAPDCHVTIEDPLISRHHAKITIREEAATLDDLQSRNGSRLNGERLRDSQVLKDGDRIRLGAQELLFYQVKEEGRKPRPTGFMAVCRKCQVPYPAGAANCPHCGEHVDGDTEARCGKCGQVAGPTDRTCTRCGTHIEREDDTISGIMLEPKSTWTFQLLVEVIDKALALGRLVEAERMMARAARETDERLETGAVDVKHVVSLSDYAMRVAEAGGGPKWAGWTVSLFRRLQRVPSSATAARIAAFAADEAVRGEIDKFVEDTRRAGATLTVDEVDAIALLQGATKPAV